MKRQAVFIFALLALAVGAFAWTRGKSGQIVPLKEAGAVTTEKAYAKLAKSWEDAYAKDVYGSTTPSGTLDLFISALERGDTDSAGRYFVPEKQTSMKDELLKGKQSGGIALLLQALKKPKTGIDMGEGAYRFRTYDKDGMAEFSFDLIQNIKTGIWKIDEL